MRGVTSVPLTLALGSPPLPCLGPGATVSSAAAAAARPPSRAVDLHGRNVIDEVRAIDHDVWISNPFGRDPENATAVRDGILVEFLRPAGAKSVKLTFNVRNTAWAST
jgi:hypothetical protein